MLVTRVGFGSKLVLAGDTKQSDLIKQKDGLSHLLTMLKNVTTRLVRTVVFLPGDFFTKPREWKKFLQVYAGDSKEVNMEVGL